jgi:Protein of unknown function (DUF1638)
MPRTGTTLLIACGALAREVLALKRAHGWDALEVTCLPASWHNRPEKIPAGVRRKIRAGRKTHERILVAYGDCGTAGELDRVLAEEGVERIAGPHCYQFYAGTTDFEALTERDPTCFFLTDYLVRHFDRLIVQGLGLDRHPELRDEYFRHYTRVVWLAQRRTPAVEGAAEHAAAMLGLPLEVVDVGESGLEAQIERLVA